MNTPFGSVVRVLVVLRQRRERLAWLRLRSAVTEIPEEPAVAGELQDAVAASAGRDPDVARPDPRRRVLVLGPERMMPGPAPRTQQVARRVELEDRGAATQHSARGGVVEAPFSSGLMSRGRLRTQIWSLRSVTIVGMPCRSYLFRSGIFGQTGIDL